MSQQYSDRHGASSSVRPPMVLSRKSVVPRRLIAPYGPLSGAISSPGRRPSGRDGAKSIYSAVRKAASSGYESVSAPPMRHVAKGPVLPLRLDKEVEALQQTNKRDAAGIVRSRPSAMAVARPAVRQEVRGARIGRPEVHSLGVGVLAPDFLPEDRGEPHPAKIGGRVVGRFARKVYPEQQFARKSTAITKTIRQPEIVVISSDESSEDEVEVDDTSSSSDSEPESTELPQRLLVALSSLTMSHTTFDLQPGRIVPFLPRTLRKGFVHRCTARGVSIQPAPRPERVDVVFTCQAEEGGEDDNDDDDDDMHRERMKGDGWVCPLCALHGKFANREMLAAHLEWDHAEVGVSWESKGTDNSQRWKVILTIRDPVPQDDDSDSDTASTGIQQASPTLPPQSPGTLRTTTLGRSPSPELKPLRERSPLLSRFRPSPPPPALNTRDTETPSAHVQFLEPAALPDISSVRSSRPGGPRLFDLLPHPSETKAGILTWQVIDREEEMFELDDVRDEDKVMQALWARWMLFNRNKFIENYEKATMDFVRENRDLIYHAAGWTALRVWLLMLVVNRFLKGPEMVKILQEYQNLVGMV